MDRNERVRQCLNRQPVLTQTPTLIQTLIQTRSLIQIQTRSLIQGLIQNSAQNRARPNHVQRMIGVRLNPND